MARTATLAARLPVARLPVARLLWGHRDRWLNRTTKTVRTPLVVAGLRRPGKPRLRALIVAVRIWLRRLRPRMPRRRSQPVWRTSGATRRPSSRAPGALAPRTPRRFGAVFGIAFRASFRAVRFPWKCRVRTSRRLAGCRRRPSHRPPPGPLLGRQPVPQPVPLRRRPPLPPFLTPSRIEPWHPGRQHRQPRWPPHPGGLARRRRTPHASACRILELPAPRGRTSAGRVPACQVRFCRALVVPPPEATEGGPLERAHRVRMCPDPFRLPIGWRTRFRAKTRKACGLRITWSWQRQSRQ